MITPDFVFPIITFSWPEQIGLRKPSQLSRQPCCSVSELVKPGGLDLTEIDHFFPIFVHYEQTFSSAGTIFYADTSYGEEQWVGSYTSIFVPFFY